LSSRSRLTIGIAVISALVAACSSGTGATQAPPAPGISSPSPVTPTSSPTPGVPTSGSPGPAAQTANSGTPGGTPQFKHVYLIVLENEEYGSLVGSANAPFLNGLIAKYGLATNYFGISHPSQPNYLALFSGSTQGVTDDGIHDIAATNLADQLEAAHKTWSVFAQDYPGGCFAGATQNGAGEGIGAAGSYARKHDPAISFTDISSNPTRCAWILNLAAFDPAAADFEFIVPNQCNDMHSCSIATGDAFLRTFVPRITSSPAFAGSVLFITTDEGTTNTNGGGQVATVVVSPLGKSGFRSAVPYDHYSLLKTIEDSWGLPCLGQACSATDMAEFFR
jgi:phosphatidylinositol-3-phosphatase